MKLEASEAKHCVSLLNDLDMFTLQTSHIVKKKCAIMDDYNKMRLKLRSRWQKEPRIIEQFIVTKKNNLSAEDSALVRGWKKATRKEYIVAKYYSEYAVFYEPKDNKFYGVLALTDDFAKVFPYNPPFPVQTTLLDFRGRIVWDGLGGMWDLDPIKGFADCFDEECDQRKRSGAIISSFHEYPNL